MQLYFSIMSRDRCCITKTTTLLPIASVKVCAVYPMLSSKLILFDSKKTGIPAGNFRGRFRGGLEGLGAEENRAIVEVSVGTPRFRGSLSMVRVIPSWIAGVAGLTGWDDNKTTDPFPVRLVVTQVIKRQAHSGTHQKRFAQQPSCDNCSIWMHYVFLDQKFKRHVQWITEQPLKVVPVDESGNTNGFPLRQILILDPLLSEPPILRGHSSHSGLLADHGLDIHIHHPFHGVGARSGGVEPIARTGDEPHFRAQKFSSLFSMHKEI